MCVGGGGKEGLSFPFSETHNPSIMHPVDPYTHNETRKSQYYSLISNNALSITRAELGLARKIIGLMDF